MSADTKLSTPSLPARPTAVYLLQRRDRTCFKLGVALDPISRARWLPEYQSKLLDLKSSLALWLPSKTRAYEVESGMHKCLAPFSFLPGHTGSGYSEWFLPKAFVPAMRMLQQVPKDTHGERSLGLRPLVEGGAVVVDRPMRTPQELWWILEDLFTRVSNLLPVSAVFNDGHWSMTIENFREARDGQMRELRPLIMNTETYGWNVGTASGDFVDLIDYERDALVLKFAPKKKIHRWVEGDTLNSLVIALMARLNARASNAQEVQHG